MAEMRQVKCPKCQKMLCKVDGNAEIKCTRQYCKAIIHYDYESDKATVVRVERPKYSEKMKNRPTSSGKTFS